MDLNVIFLPSREVRRRYGVSDMCLWRWLRRPDLVFQADHHQRAPTLEAERAASLGSQPRKAGGCLNASLQLQGLDQ